MKKELNRYEQILEISDIADNLDYEYRSEIEKDEDKVKKIINKPQVTRKIPYEAYQKYFGAKKK